MGKARGQCGPRLPARPGVEAITAGKILPPAAPIAGIFSREGHRNSIVYRVFRGGTVLAEPRGVKCGPRFGGVFRSLTMLFALGAVSTAFGAVQSLASAATSSTQSSSGFEIPGAAQASPNSAGTTGFTGGGSQISPATMEALLAAQSQSTTSASTSASASSASTSPADALQDLFSQIDANGDGSITKSEFENALGAGGTNTAAADDVFSKLDSNGDGSVSLDELSSALKGAAGKGGHHGHHHVASSGTSADGGTDPSSDPLLQALDASSSTSSSSSLASTSLINQMIQRQVPISAIPIFSA
jgi:hypothetical protein